MLGDLENQPEILLGLVLHLYQGVVNKPAQFSFCLSPGALLRSQCPAHALRKDDSIQACLHGCSFNLFFRLLQLITSKRLFGRLRYKSYFQPAVTPKGDKLGSVG